MANAIIEGHDCTLFYDYDFYRDGILQQLSDDGKIAWLKLRIQMIFMEPMSSLFDRGSQSFKEINTSRNGYPRTGTLLTVSLLMNGIEALGSFFTKKGSKKKLNFFTFINRYMSTWNIKVRSPRHQNKQLLLSEILWYNYRNELAHSFAIDGAGIDRINGTHKYKVDGYTIQIDVWKFFVDFQHAVNQIFIDVCDKPDVRELFLARFKMIYKC